MKADLTRNTFDPLKQFTRVLMQQGRVQLDSDWNEQAAILLRYLRTLGADLIGPAGGPGSSAFALAPVPVPSDFRIELGRYYVDGILCEADAGTISVIASASIPNEVTVRQWTLDGRAFEADQLVELFDDVAQPFATPGFNPTVAQIATANQAGGPLTFSPAVDITKGINPSIRRVLTYLTQPDLPETAALAQTTGANGAYLVYLDVWERHITCIEDGSIREVALGGPDTATRAKIIWQVKVVKGKVQDPNSGKPCDGFTPDDDKFFPNLFGPNHGLLKARALRKSAATDPCIIAPDANYHGAENQLLPCGGSHPGCGGGSADGGGGESGRTGSQSEGDQRCDVQMVARERIGHLSDCGAHFHRRRPDHSHLGKSRTGRPLWLKCREPGRDSGRRLCPAKSGGHLARGSVDRPQ